MRIGVDLLAIQAPSCRGRGIGRYAKSLLRALLVEAPSWQFVFYRRADLKLDWDEDDAALVAEWVVVEPDPPGDPDGTLQQIVQRNPHRLDWLLIPNPIVERRGFALPEPVPGGPRLAAVVYDLIPALYPGHYLDDPKLAGEYFRDLRRLRTYDVVLAISEATGRDVRTHLSVPERRIVNIRAATDPEFFRPAGDEREEDADGRALRDLGLSGPYFYYLGNVDWRKNVLGLVDAYALLPDEVRAAHPLVLTFGANAWFSAVLREKLDALGLGDRVVATGPVGDEIVRALYRRATLFLSPSLYEGFGLPILEAMSCGAAVVIADNSSQPEVAGPAGVLAASDQPGDWAEKIAGLVADPDRLSSLRRAALIQSRRFSWGQSARRLRDAIEAAPGREARGGPRLAVVAHPARKGSEYGAETAEILGQLARKARPLVFVDEDRPESLFPLPVGSGWYEKGLLGRVRPILGDPPVLHLVDTLDSLSPLVADLRLHPGSVVFGNGRIAALSDLAQGDGVEDELREVLRLATAVVCHSPWLHDEVCRLAREEDGIPPPSRPPAVSRAG